MVLFYRFSQREIEPGIVSNVLVEAAGQAQSPPPRDAEPVAPPRRRSLKETSFDAEASTQLHWVPGPIRIRTPHLMATLYCTEIVPLCTDLDSDSDPGPDPQLLLHLVLGCISVHGSGSESVSGNVNKPLQRSKRCRRNCLLLSLCSL